MPYLRNLWRKEPSIMQIIAYFLFLRKIHKLVEFAGRLHCSDAAFTDLDKNTKIQSR